MQAPAVIPSEALQGLLDALSRRHYRLVGPTVRDGAIVYDDISRVDELPIGWTDVQDNGTYRLAKRADGAFFGFVVGPHTWKRYTHPPVGRLWRAARQGQDIEFLDEPDEPVKYAFIGIRACELQAIAVQDRVFLHGAYVDPVYAARRNAVFTVAINCAQAGGTCFCVSMQSGPRATHGFDLALTEVVQATRHEFVVEVGSEQGADVLREVPHREAQAADIAEVERIVVNTAAQMGRRLEVEGLKELLYRNLEHPRWDDVATRCLSCTNCTMVCPTCFCTTVEDVTDLSGTQAERWRKWDSCFTQDFSYIHGGSVRTSTRSRYRHWLTHKLATWIDQFGTSGCVGCGRCITWCPVGIDLTEEVLAIRGSDGAIRGQEARHGDP